jgi:hypothetical protein
MNREQELLRLINAYAADEPVDVNQLWLLSMKTVGGFRSTLYGKLRSEREDLVSDFVLRKIIVGRKTFPAFGALINAFQNYLRDVLRHENFSESLDERATDEDGQSHGCEIPDFGQSTEDVVHAKRMDAAAEVFVGSLPQGERAYLSESKVCREDGDAVSAVAKRYRITNYHAKARELGIYQHENSVTAADYSETVIGRWITQTLGIPLAVERLPEIRAAMVAMCRIAAMLAFSGKEHSQGI